MKQEKENNNELKYNNTSEYKKLKKKYDKLNEKYHILQLYYDKMYYINIRNNSLNKNINNEKQVPIINYIFPKKFLINIDSSLNINSILQCLAYISELNLYFLNEYPIDSLALKRKNNNIKSKGELSSSFII